MESNIKCSLKIAEEDLIQASQAGDAVAFEGIYKIYRGQIYRLITRLCGNPDDAEDLTQEFFIRLWQKIGQFKFESSFYTWMCRIAFNITFTKMGKQGRIRFMEQPLDSAPDLPDHAQDRCPLEHKERCDQLEEALLSLPDEERIVIVSHDLEEMPYEECSDLLGIGTARLGQFRHKGLERLKSKMQKGSHS